jgi:hypothetical protein
VCSVIWQITGPHTVNETCEWQVHVSLLLLLECMCPYCYCRSACVRTVTAGVQVSLLSLLEYVSLLSLLGCIYPYCHCWNACVLLSLLEYVSLLSLLEYVSLLSLLECMCLSPALDLMKRKCARSTWYKVSVSCAWMHYFFSFEVSCNNCRHIDIEANAVATTSLYSKGQTKYYIILRVKQFWV